MISKQEIETAYNDFLEYENEVKEFLLYVCGFHNGNEIQVYAEKSKKMLNDLEKKRHQSKYCRLILLINKAEEENHSNREPERLSYLRGEFLKIDRNIKEWINSAKILMKFYKIL